MIRLTMERTGRGWSKARLARAAGIDQSLLGKIEAGRVRPYPCELERLAVALGMEPSHAAELLIEPDEAGCPCR